MSYIFAVFPTLVGVFPNAGCLVLDLFGLPHARGGVSCYRYAEPRRPLSSPRSWGCFSIGRLHRSGQKVFPTLVGVFPIK